MGQSSSRNAVIPTNNNSNTPMVPLPQVPMDLPPISEVPTEILSAIFEFVLGYELTKNVENRGSSFVKYYIFTERSHCKLCVLRSVCKRWKELIEANDKNHPISLKEKLVQTEWVTSIMDEYMQRMEMTLHFASNFKLKLHYTGGLEDKHGTWTISKGVVTIEIEGHSSALECKRTDYSSRLLVKEPNKLGWRTTVYFDEWIEETYSESEEISGSEGEE